MATTKVHSFAISSDRVTAPFTTEAADTIYTLTQEDQEAKDVRMVRVGWKTTKTNPKPRTAIWIAVPTVRVTDVNPLAFLAVLHDRIDELQDTLIRNWLEAHPEDVSGVIPASEINMQAILDLYRKEAAGKRLSQDSIKAWFDDNLSDSLMAALSAKIANITPDQLATAVQGYRNKFPALAAPVPALSLTELSQLEKAVSLAADSPLKSALAEKIGVALKKFQDDNSLAGL